MRVFKRIDDLTRRINFKYCRKIVIFLEYFQAEALVRHLETQMSEERRKNGVVDINLKNYLQRHEN